MNIEKYVERLAKTVAITGGLALVSIALMTGVSIFGRVLLPFGLKPISGDFELVEAGTAFVVTAFLPWCQLQRGHAEVTILADMMGKRANMIIDFAVDFLLFAAAAVMTWRHILGLLDKQKYGETTFILQYPLWWAYAACLLGLVTWVVVGLWATIADIEALKTGERRLASAGTVH